MIGEGRELQREVFLDTVNKIHYASSDYWINPIIVIAHFPQC